MKYFYKIIFILFSIINIILCFTNKYDSKEANLLGRISAAVSSENYFDCMMNDKILQDNVEIIFSYNESHSKLKGNFLAGIIRLKKDPETLIIVHKSTSSTKQLITEGIYALLPKEEFLNSGKVYLYHMKALNVTYDVIANEIKKLMTYGNYKYVIFTGHSLGGGLAVLDSYRCVHENICESDKTKVVTFGAPRTGNCKFVENYNQKVPYTYRVVVKDDLVPTIPACESPFWDNSCRSCHESWFDLYYHVGTEIYYINGTSGDFEVCQKFIEDPKCSSKIFGWLDFPRYIINADYYYKKHTNYFETVFNQTYDETKCDFYID